MAGIDCNKTSHKTSHRTPHKEPPKEVTYAMIAHVLLPLPLGVYSYVILDEGSFLSNPLFDFSLSCDFSADDSSVGGLSSQNLDKNVSSGASVGGDDGMSPFFKDSFSSRLAPGDLVIVPFRNKEMYGVVWDIERQNITGKKLKSLSLCVRPQFLNERMRTFIKRVSHYYVIPMGLVLAMVMPGYKNYKEEGIAKRKNKVKEDVISFAPIQTPLSKAQQEIADHLVTCGYGVHVLEGVTGSGKTNVYFEKITHLLKEGKQVLVLVPEIALLIPLQQRFFKHFGFKPVLWHSSMTPKKRRDSYTHIQKGEARVVLGTRSALFLPMPKLGMIVVDEEHDSGFKQEEGVCYHGRDMAVLRARVCNIPIILASATPSMETIFNVLNKRYKYYSLKERYGVAVLPHVEVVDLIKDPLPKGRFISESLRLELEKTLVSKKQSLLFLNRRGYAPLFLCRGCGYRMMCPSCSVWLTGHGVVGCETRNNSVDDMGRELGENKSKENKSEHETRKSNTKKSEFEGKVGVTLGKFSTGKTDEYNKKDGESGRPFLRCHYCDYGVPLPRTCPECHEEDHFVACGPGVERIAEEVSRLFPHAKVEMAVSDILSTPLKVEKFVERVMNQEVDIIVGTQMMAKGYHFPHLACVGVVDMDAALFGPDFRAVEKGYQMISQIMGRAGREKEQGKVLLQTMYADSPLVKCLLKHDVATLLSMDLEARKREGWAPFSKMAGVVVSSADKNKAHEEARALVRYLWGACDYFSSQEFLSQLDQSLENVRQKRQKQKENKENNEPWFWHHDLEKKDMKSFLREIPYKKMMKQAECSGFNIGFDILGPVEAPLFMLRGEYRYRIIIKVCADSLLSCDSDDQVYVMAYIMHAFMKSLENFSHKKGQVQKTSPFARGKGSSYVSSHVAIKVDLDPISFM